LGRKPIHTLVSSSLSQLFHAHGRPQGGQSGQLFPLEIGIKNQKFLVNLKAVVQIRLLI